MTYKGINFNGDHGSGQGFNYWCNFTANNWWLADRLLVLVQVTGTNADLILEVYNSGIGSTYFPDMMTFGLDASNYSIIDLTEIARTYPPNAHTISMIYGQESEPPQYWTIILSTAAKGYINPDGVLIPTHPLSSYAQIVPPSRMIGAFTAQDTADIDFYILQFEFRASGSWKCTEYQPQALSPITITQPTYRLDDWGTEKFVIRKDGQGTQPQQTYILQPMQCGKQYAQVRWVSFTGATRIHIFEVIKSTQTTKDAYSLMNIGGEYTEIKGREDSFKLYIDGLTAYDYWYYADILQSSKVEVCLKDQVFRRVQVTTNEATIPDGDAGDGKLEINVKWHDYDAVAL